MRLKVLGTGTGTPSLSRLSSSYLLTTSWGTILVDIGPSVVRRLLELGYTIHDIDLIIITHFHPDHTADLATFLFAAGYGEPRREKPLMILGGRGIRSFYRRLVRLYRWVSPAGYDLKLVALGKRRLQLGTVSKQASRMDHNPESIAVRIEDGKSVVFTGDTDYSPDVVKLSSRAHLLVTECSFPDRKVKGHLDLPTLERIVNEARPEKVILSHLFPEWEAFRGVLHAPLLLGVDGMELEI